MITFDQWQLPDGETHLPEWMRTTNRRVDGRLTYQYHKYEAAIRHCRQRRVAIDVGAHCGLWSFWMARDFATLHAFEPKTAHIDCWKANVPAREGVTLHPVALGDRVGQVGLYTGPGSSGDTQVRLDAPHPTVPMCRLDDFSFEDVDFLKIDTEGFEAFVLEGGKELLARCRPVVIVEQKPGHGRRFGRRDMEAIRVLERVGAERVWDQAGDYVMTFAKEAA